jgi:hypothetical protein
MVSARPSLHRHAALILIAALAVTIAADVITADATLAGLLAGRVLNGLALGFAGGAAATLALAAQGQRARTVVATATVVGGLTGTVLSVALAVTLHDPLRLNYVVHGAVTLVVLAALVVSLLATRARGRYTEAHARAEALLRYRPSIGFALGMAAWGCGTLVVVLVPNGAMRTIPGVDLVVATLGTVVMLLAAAVAQYGLAGLRPRAALHFSFATLAAGMIVLAIGMEVGSIITVLCGCVVIGAGEGLGYRTGLRVISGGLGPRRQGARTSAYACAAYGVSAGLVVAGGWAVAGIGYGPGTIVVAAILLPISLSCMLVVEYDYRRGAESATI